MDKQSYSSSAENTKTVKASENTGDTLKGIENTEANNIPSNLDIFRTIFISCSSLSIGLILSLIGWYYWDIVIIHPVFSIPMLIGTSVFSVMSFMRLTEIKSQDSTINKE